MVETLVEVRGDAVVEGITTIAVIGTIPAGQRRTQSFSFPRMRRLGCRASWAPGSLPPRRPCKSATIGPMRDHHSPDHHATHHGPNHRATHNCDHDGATHECHNDRATHECHDHSSHHDCWHYRHDDRASDHHHERDHHNDW